MKFLSSNGLRKLIELVKNAFIKKEDVVETETIDLIETEAVTLDPIATDGIPDLDTIRSNASTGAGLAPQVEVNTQRIEELTIAKFPNVVIVGTPHIEGGQVSNYSDTSYLQFPFVDISRGQPFDIYFSFTTTQDITTQQNILDAHFGIALAVQNGRGVMALSSNGTSWDIGTTTGTNTLLPNTTYYVKYSWTGTQYNASLSTDDQEYVPDMTINSTLSPYKTTIFIGGSPNIFGAGSAHPFKGTINFNKSKVVVNGITVWEGMADVGLASRANVSLNNLDEVGEARFTDIQTAIDGKQPIGNYALKSELPTLARANVPGLVAGGNWLTVNQTTGKMECGELTKAQFDSALGCTFISKTTLNNVLTPKLSEKQDKLTAGDGIKIENNVISLENTGDLVDFVQPLLTENGIFGGTNFAVLADSEIDTSRQAWKAFDGNIRLLLAETDQWHSDYGQPHWIAWSNPTLMKVTQVTIYNGADNVLPQNWQFEYSDDSIDWEELTSGTNNNLTANGMWSFDVPDSGLHRFYRFKTTSGYGIDNAYLGLTEIQITGKVVKSDAPQLHHYKESNNSTLIGFKLEETGTLFNQNVQGQNANSQIINSSYNNRNEGSIATITSNSDTETRLLNSNELSSEITGVSGNHFAKIRTFTRRTNAEEYMQNYVSAIEAVANRDNTEARLTLDSQYDNMREEDALTATAELSVGETNNVTQKMTMTRDMTTFTGNVDFSDAKVNGIVELVSVLPVEQKENVLYCLP